MDANTELCLTSNSWRQDPELFQRASNNHGRIPRRHTCWVRPWEQLIQGLGIHWGVWALWDANRHKQNKDTSLASFLDAS